MRKKYVENGVIAMSPSSANIVLSNPRLVGHDNRGKSQGEKSIRMILEWK
jgi:hypothetical protein